MKNFKLIFITIILLFSGLNAKSQKNSSDSSITTDTTNPKPNENDFYIDPIESNFLVEEEFWLSLMVLIFGILVIVLEVNLIKTKTIDVDQAAKLIVVTLIITASLFLITAAFNPDRITPVIGLLGTIVGYLLGTSNNNESRKT